MYLGQDDYNDFTWSQVTEVPASNPNIFSGMSDPGAWSMSSPAQSTDSWWSGITGALGPISTAAANIIKAITGQPATNPTGAPAGYTRNSQGQLVPLPNTGGFNIQTLLLPAALGVGAYMLLKQGKRR